MHGIIFAVPRDKSILLLFHLSLNQAGTGLRLAHAWFLKIDPVRIVGMRVRVCVCVCPRPRLLITRGVT